MVLSVLMAVAASISSAPNQAEMIRIADAFDRAQLVQDRKALEAMVDDELVFIDGSGKRLGKKQFVEGWTDAGTRYNPIILIDRTVSPLGTDSFVVSAETTLSGNSGDKDFSSRFRFSDTFRRRDGRWQAIHIQVTRIGN